MRFPFLFRPRPRTRLFFGDEHEDLDEGDFSRESPMLGQAAAEHERCHVRQ